MSVGENTTAFSKFWWKLFDCSSEVIAIMDLTRAIHSNKGKHTSAEAPHIKAFKLPTACLKVFLSGAFILLSVPLRCFHLISSKKPLRRDSLLFWRGRQEQKSCDQISTYLNYDLACRWPFQGQPMRYELYQLHNNSRLQEYPHISFSPPKTDVTGVRRRERLLNLVTRHYTWCVILHLILLPSYDLFLLGHFFIEKKNVDTKGWAGQYYSQAIVVQ